MHWQRHKHGRAHADAWGARIPVAVAIGTEPALTYAATAPLTADARRVRLCRPAAREAGRARPREDASTFSFRPQAEFVLEGYVDNDDLRARRTVRRSHRRLQSRGSLSDLSRDLHHASPRSDRTPRRSLESRRWKTRGSARRPNESSCRSLQAMLPEVVDMNLPVEGGFHNLAIVSIRKSYPGQAKKVMNALWGLGHMMMLTRVLVIVDADVDVQDPRAVAWFVLNNLAPERDVVTMPGPVDDLDHGSYSVAYGTKIGIDATRKDASEGYTREWPPEMIMDDATRRLVNERWRRTASMPSKSALQPDDWSGQGLGPTTGSCACRTNRANEGDRPLPARDSHRAYALRPTVRLRRRDIGRSRDSFAGRTALDHACGVGCAYGGDGGKSLPRSRDRRAQSAHRATRACHRSARAGDDAVGERRGTRAAARVGVDAQSALRQTHADRCAAAPALSTLQTLHLDHALRARRRRRARAARRLHRRLPGESRCRPFCFSLR